MQRPEHFHLRTDKLSCNGRDFDGYYFTMWDNKFQNGKCYLTNANVPIEKLTIEQLSNKLPTFWNRNILHLVLKHSLSDAILNPLNSTYKLTAEFILDANTLQVTLSETLRVWREDTKEQESTWRQQIFPPELICSHDYNFYFLSIFSKYLGSSHIRRTN